MRANAYAIIICHAVENRGGVLGFDATATDDVKVRVDIVREHVLQADSRSLAHWGQMPNTGIHANRSVVASINCRVDE